MNIRQLTFGGAPSPTVLKNDPLQGIFFDKPLVVKFNKPLRKRIIVKFFPKKTS